MSFVVLGTEYDGTDVNGDVIAVWWLGIEDGNSDDSGDDENGSGNDESDSGDDKDDSGDDENGSGDDENDNGDDGSDQVRGETPMYLTMSCHSFRSWARLAHSSRTFPWAVIVNIISYPASDEK